MLLARVPLPVATASLQPAFDHSMRIDRSFKSSRPSIDTLRRVVASATHCETERTVPDLPLRFIGCISSRCVSLCGLALGSRRRAGRFTNNLGDPDQNGAGRPTQIRSGIRPSCAVAITDDKRLLIETKALDATLRTQWVKFSELRA